jgi:hypothetical protein
VVVTATCEAGGVATLTISDNVGSNAYTSIDVVTNGSFVQYTWYVANVNGSSSFQVTINSTLTGVLTCAITEYSGAALTLALDSHTPGFGTLAPGNFGGFTSVSRSGDVVYCALAWQHVAATTVGATNGNQRLSISSTGSTSGLVVADILNAAPPNGGNSFNTPSTINYTEVYAAFFAPIDLTTIPGFAAGPTKQVASGWV